MFVIKMKEGYENIFKKIQYAKKSLFSHHNQA